MRMMKKLVAFLLCLSLLLPTLALADGEATAVSFDLSFQMDASAYPEDDQAVLSGVADLMNILTTSGTFAWQGKSFDLDFDILLDGAEETRTPFHVYGLDSHWQVESSLLGEQKALFNMLACLEFAMKAYSYLGTTLQYPALMICPFATDSALWLVKAPLEAMVEGEGSRVISRDDVLAAAAAVADAAAQDRSFEYWIKALFLDLGYDDMIFEGMSMMPDWADSFVAEEGITVTVSDGTETWVTGDTTLFTRAMTDASEAWSLTLPATLEGYSLTVSYAAAKENGLTNTAIHLGATMAEENDILDISIAAANIPQSLPLTAKASVAIDMEGEMLGQMAQHARFEAEGNGDSVTIRQLDAITNAPMLTITGIMTQSVPETAPSYAVDELDGADVFSVNDNSLAELVQSVKDSFTTAFMPLLLHLPATGYASIFQLLTDYGILDLLMEGLD